MTNSCANNGSRVSIVAEASRHSGRILVNMNVRQSVNDSSRGNKKNVGDAHAGGRLSLLLRRVALILSED